MRSARPVVVAGPIYRFWKRSRPGVRFTFLLVPKRYAASGLTMRSNTQNLHKGFERMMIRNVQERAVPCSRAIIPPRLQVILR